MEGVPGWQLLQCPTQVTSDFSGWYPAENVAKREADCSEETYSPLCKTCRVLIGLEDGLWSGWLWSGQCWSRAELWVMPATPELLCIASSLSHSACEPLKPFRYFLLVEIFLTHLSSPKKWDSASEFFYFCGWTEKGERNKEMEELWMENRP